MARHYPPAGKARRDANTVVQVDDPFFVVGAPRSGTTLVRMILDSHPRLSIPPESQFVVALAPGRLPWRWRPATIEDVFNHPLFKTWRLDEARVRDQVAEVAPTNFPELISAIFGCYAAAHGKPRWGDKTPGYVSYLPVLLKQFPEARFIHVIRDGRDVATSLSEQRWGPRSAVSGAAWWRKKVERGIIDGRRLPADRYIEIHLEDLILEPEKTIETVCLFLGEGFDPDMLRYYETIATETLGPGAIHLTKPVSPNLRDWRAGRGRWEQRAIEASCRPLLMTLGYPAPAPDPLALGLARLIRARDLTLGVPKAIRDRISPKKRLF